jgi:hypothetical protein
MSLDPVFYHDGGGIYDDDLEQKEPAGWYFWDETWSSYVGPYTTEGQARRMLKEYADSL